MSRRHYYIVHLLGLVGALMAPDGPAVADDAAMRPVFALVVGVNEPIEGKARLRYADDDAVQNAAFATQLGAVDNVVLLTEMDEETQLLYPRVHPGIPSKKNLLRAMRRLNGAMKAAGENGASPEFFFFYTGHGNVHNNTGYVSLTDGQLTRNELFDILNSSMASRNHLIIDSCKSYFMVFDRGPGGVRRPVSAELNDSLTLPANTGVFLSTSSAANSHEWEAISAGVFSHEVRSALRGGADSNLDGRVTYEEAAAFVWNANRAVPVKRFRPAFYMHPPEGESASESILADLTVARGNWLHVQQNTGFRQYIEDGNGVRIAEYHPGSNQRMSILIPSERPLFVRHPDSSVEYVLPRTTNIDLAALDKRNATVGQRGAEHVAFLKLFDVPFGGPTLSQYRKAKRKDVFGPQSQAWRSSPNSITPNGGRDMMDGVRRDNLDIMRRSAGIFSLVFAGTGALLSGLSYRQYATAPAEESQLAAISRNETIARLNTIAFGCYVTAGIMMGSYVIWTILKNRKKRHTGIYHTGMMTGLALPGNLSNYHEKNGM